MDNLKWEGVSLELAVTPDNRKDISFFESMSIGEFDNDKYIIYPSKSDVLHLDSYLEEVGARFNRVANEYFRIIDFSCELQFIYYSIEKDRWIHEKKEFSEDVGIFKEIIGNNRIVTGSVGINLNNFSIKLLKEWPNQTNRIKTLRKLLILLVISNVCDINPKNMNEFTFVVEYEGNRICTNFNYSCDDFKGIEILDQLYDWIVNEKGYENSFKQKLDVLRSIFLRNNSFEIKETVLESAQSIFKRIIKNETDKYFEEIKQLKNDFLTIAERENSIYQSLHIKLLGWLGALGITLFDKIKDYDGTDVYNRLLESDSQKTRLLLVMLIIALVFVLMLYCVEVKNIQKEYKKLKSYYTDCLMINDNSFRETVKFPKVNSNYFSTILFLNIIIGWRVFLTGIPYIVVGVTSIIVFMLMIRHEFIEKVCNKIDEEV